MSDTDGAVVFRALDYRFRVQADAPLDAELARALAPLSLHDPSHDAAPTDPIETIQVRMHGDGWTIVGDDGERRATSAAFALARTLEHVNQRAAASTPAGAPLHAATVSHPTGPLVALAGVSGSGKSTLGAAAILQGWRFVAEEVSLVRATDGVVVPYRRPVGLRAGGAAALGIQIPDDAEGLYDEVYPWTVAAERWGTGGALAAVAIIDRRPGGGRGGGPEFERRSPPAALAELIEHVVVPSDPDVVPVFRSLERLVRSVPVARLGFDSPSDGLQLVEQLLGLA